MDAFAAAKRQFRLHLRPDEVLAEARGPRVRPGSRKCRRRSRSSPNGAIYDRSRTRRASRSISDFYRARFLYRLSQGGEAVEAAAGVFVQALKRRAELQTVALEDIAGRSQALRALAAESAPDAAKVHETLRDLVRVFEGLAENAQAFMAGIARSIELAAGRCQPPSSATRSG